MIVDGQWPLSEVGMYEDFICLYSEDDPSLYDDHYTDFKTFIESCLDVHKVNDLFSLPDVYLRFTFFWEKVRLQAKVNWSYWLRILFHPVALRKAKIVYNFGLSECNRVKKEIPKIFIETNDEMTGDNVVIHPSKTTLYLLVVKFWSFVLKIAYNGRLP